MWYKKIKYCNFIYYLISFRVLIKSILLTVRPSIIYEAQRRLNKCPQSQRDNLFLGDLESCKKARGGSSNTIFDYFKEKYFKSKLNRESHEFANFMFLRKAKITPSNEIKENKSDVILEWYIVKILTFCINYQHWQEFKPTVL